jgi:arylsulfatase A-like enzyme
MSATISPRPDIISAYRGNQFGLSSQRMLRDRRWKYVWNLTAEDELYDLESDPAEVVNLATEPVCASTLKRLRLRLLDWLQQTGDPLAHWAGQVQLGEGLKR